MTRLIIVMGVSGCGKSVVGSRLANEFECDFVDGDDLHPAENVEKMRAGEGLNDELRKPWLAAICELADSYFSDNNSLVVACSALKRKYRIQLRSVSCPVRFVFLNGSQELIHKRLQDREGHYMPVSLLDSQFADLEKPTDEADVFEVSIDQEVDQVVDDAIRLLSNSEPGEES